MTSAGESPLVLKTCRYHPEEPLQLIQNQMAILVPPPYVVMIAGNPSAPVSQVNAGHLLVWVWWCQKCGYLEFHYK